MTYRYAVLNRVDSSDDVFGTVLSRHNTLDAAARGQDAVQPKGDMYLPTSIIELSGPVQIGQRVHNTRSLDETMGLMRLDGGIDCGSVVDMLDVMAVEDAR